MCNLFHSVINIFLVHIFIYIAEQLTQSNISVAVIVRFHLAVIFEYISFNQIAAVKAAESLEQRAQKLAL